MGDVFTMDAPHHDREDGPHARGAHAHADGWTSPLGIEETFLRGFFKGWKNAEAQIASYNNVKKAMLAKTRALYGPHHTDALKLACQLAMKDEAKVARSDVHDKVARDYLKVLRDYQ